MRAKKLPPSPIPAIEDVPSLLHEVKVRAQDVRHQLGPGFPASLYLQGLRLELERAGIGARKVDVLYKDAQGTILTFRPGPMLVVGRSAVVYAMVVDRLSPRHRDALSRRMDAVELEAGLLLNFADVDVATVELVREPCPIQPP